MIEHKTTLLKQLHEQDNTAVVNSAVLYCVTQLCTVL